VAKKRARSRQLFGLQGRVENAPGRWVRIDHRGRLAILVIPVVLVVVALGAGFLAMRKAGVGRVSWGELAPILVTLIVVALIGWLAFSSGERSVLPRFVVFDEQAGRVDHCVLWGVRQIPRQEIETLVVESYAIPIRDGDPRYACSVRLRLRDGTTLPVTTTRSREEARPAVSVAMNLAEQIEASLELPLECLGFDPSEYD